MTSRRRRPLSPEEEALWEAVTKGDKPLRHRNVLTPPEAPRPRRQPMTGRGALQFGAGDPGAQEIGTPSRAPRPGSTEMDGNLAQKLRRGQLPIDGKIDLHGLTVRAAEDRLNRYIAGALAMGKRCILVITGKGALPPEPHERDYMPDRPRPGAIRASLPQWLERGPNAGHILAIQPAQPKHGGGGAFYVLLRRRRDT